MPRIKLLALASVLAVVLSVPLTADAAPPVIGTDTDVEDLHYDFEVWMAPEVMVWIVKVVFDGTTTYYEFETFEEMEEFAVGAWRQLGDDASIQMGHKIVPGPWEYVVTYDKRADAEQLANLIRSFGSFAKVERVSAFRSATTLKR